MIRIGIYGGTFNPVHIAHLITAEEVRVHMQLDKVIFVPDAIPAIKDHEGMPDIQKRIEMLKLATKDNDSFEVSDVESKLPTGTKTYTVNTLLALREQYKGEQVKLYLIIGMDQLIDLHKWKDPGKLFMLSEVLVINRPGYLAQQIENEYSRAVVYVPVPSLDISSTDIRFRLKEKRSIKYLVTGEVEDYIFEQKLYR